jgi:hypothetical protein
MNIAKIMTEKVKFCNSPAAFGGKVASDRYVVANPMCKFRGLLATRLCDAIPMGEVGEIAAVCAGGKHGERCHLANSTRRETREAPPGGRAFGGNEGANCCCATFANAWREEGSLLPQMQKA